MEEIELPQRVIDPGTSFGVDLAAGVVVLVVLVVLLYLWRRR